MHKITQSKLILIFTDLITIFSPIFISFYFLDVFSEREEYFSHDNFLNYVFIHFSLSILIVIWFWIRLRHYTYRKPFWFELKEVLRTLSIFFVIELAIVALSKLYISRSLWFLIWGMIFFLTPFFRIFIKLTLIKIGLFLKETVIIGNGKNAKSLYDALVGEKYLGLKVKLFVDTNNTDVNWLENIPVAKHNPELLLSIVNKDLTQFVLAIDEGNIEKQDFWLRFLMKKGCRAVSIIPSITGVPLYGTDMSFLFGYDFIFLRLNNNLAKRSSKMIKRAIDIFGSILIIILFSPLLLILYFLIKRDGGDAIYGHTRVGQNGKLFKCLKFRSMVLNSQQVLEELLASDPAVKAEWEQDFKLRNDPRITKVGSFLRKTSLDELPQLFNVLKGEMSLVGPRPIIEEELERYKLDSDYYFMAKPGMTGLWQVSGRNNVDYATRVYFDAWYVKNWSIWNDIVILLKTINVVLKRDGAY